MCYGFLTDIYIACNNSHTSLLSVPKISNMIGWGLVDHRGSRIRLNGQMQDTLPRVKWLSIWNSHLQHTVIVISWYAPEFVSWSILSLSCYFNKQIWGLVIIIIIIISFIRTQSTHKCKWGHTYKVNYKYLSGQTPMMKYFTANK